MHVSIIDNSTIPARYPVSHIHNFTLGLQGLTVFSKLDRTKSYYQIPVADADILKTAVTKPFGLFQYWWMFFRLRNTAQTFQHLIDNVLRGLSHTYAYIDDVFIEIPDETQHKQHLLHEVLQKLAHHDMKINVDNCIFGVKQCSFRHTKLTETESLPCLKRWKRYCNSNRQRQFVSGDDSWDL